MDGPFNNPEIDNFMAEISGYNRSRGLKKPPVSPLETKLLKGNVYLTADNAKSYGVNDYIDPDWMVKISPEGKFSYVHLTEGTTPTGVIQYADEDITLSPEGRWIVKPKTPVVDQGNPYDITKLKNWTGTNEEINPVSGDVTAPYTPELYEKANPKIKLPKIEKTMEDINNLETPVSFNEFRKAYWAEQGWEFGLPAFNDPDRTAKEEEYQRKLDQTVVAYDERYKQYPGLRFKKPIGEYGQYIFQPIKFVDPTAKFSWGDVGYTAVDLASFGIFGKLAKVAKFIKITPEISKTIKIGDLVLSKDNKVFRVLEIGKDLKVEAEDGIQTILKSDAIHGLAHFEDVAKAEGKITKDMEKSLKKLGLSTDEIKVMSYEDAIKKLGGEVADVSKVEPPVKPTFEVPTKTPVTNVTPKIETPPMKPIPGVKTALPEGVEGAGKTVGKIESNQIKTITGRTITAPDIRVSTNRKATIDTKKADDWLYNEAKKELDLQSKPSNKISSPSSKQAKIEFQQQLLSGMDAKKLTQADKDTLWDILTGNPDAPAVFRLTEQDITRANYNKKVQESLEGQQKTAKVETALSKKNQAPVIKQPELTKDEARKIARMSPSELDAYNKKVAESETVKPVTQTGITTVPPKLPPPAENTVTKMSDDFYSYLIEHKVTTMPAEDVDSWLDLFEGALVSKDLKIQREYTEQLRKIELAKRASNASGVAEDIFLKTGNVELAMKEARKELSGELPVITTDMLASIVQDTRQIYMAKVRYHWTKVEKQYSFFEENSAMEALAHALDTGDIPRKRGTGALPWFPEGGSAYDRLAKVFGKESPILKAIDQKKPIEDVVDGVFHEIGRDPIPLDQKTTEYLQSLSDLPRETETGQLVRVDMRNLQMGLPSMMKKPWTPQSVNDLRTSAEKLYAKDKLELDIKLSKGQLTKETHDLESSLLKNKYFPDREIPQELKDYLDKFGGKPDELGFNVQGEQIGLTNKGWTPEMIKDIRTAAEKIYAKDKLGLETALAKGEITKDEFLLQDAIAKNILKPFPDVTPFEAPIKDAIKQVPLWPEPAVNSIIRVLKEMAWSPVDIGGFIKAMKSSVDMSYWRQIMPLIPGHPKRFALSNITAWKGLFSQKSAEAAWIGITHSRLYAIYDEIQKAVGTDFLRPFDLPKGTAQWKGVEEFGYLTKDRLIPRLTSKIPTIKWSNRAFVSGCNSHLWGCFEDFYKAQKRIQEKYISGELKLKVGEVFDVNKNMTEYAKMLADWSGRASLGKLSTAASALGNLLYAPRFAWGRIISPRHLFSTNPYVRKQAWKDAILFTGTIGGLVMAGRQMGWWDVELDRNSADFMKIRIGDTRIDPWGGVIQFVTFLSRIFDLGTAPLTGETAMAKSSVTGQEYPLNFTNLFTNFLEGKSAPLMSIINEYMNQKTFSGEDVDYSDIKQWIDRVGPMAIGDMMDAITEGEGNVPRNTILSFFGFGVQQYSGDWKDNFSKLGIEKYPDVTGYVYDTKDLWTDTAKDFTGVDPATMTESKGFPVWIKTIAEVLKAKEEADLLQNQKLISMNIDPAKGPTVFDYYKMWQDREKIVASGDTEKLKEFDSDERTKNAYLGNISQSQLSLLTEYWGITDKKKQQEFLDKHPELSENPRDEWWQSHTKENGIMAIFGQMKILTKEAYDTAMKLVKEWDIPASAVEPYLPPKEIVKPYFERQDIVDKYGANSWEDKLLRIDNPDLVKWLNDNGSPLGDVDTPREALELKIKHRDLYDQVDSYSDKDSPDYIADDKVRQEAIKKLKADNPDWVEDMHRIDAIEKGTIDEPTSDAIINEHLEYSKIIDTEGLGSTSAEAMLYRVDHPDYNTWRMSDAWGDNALQEIDQTKIDGWRIDVKYRKEDAVYDALPTTGTERADYLASHEEYRLDRRRREAYSKGFTDELVNKYVEYNELPLSGYRRDRFLIDNLDYAIATGMKVPDRVPSEQYDILLENPNKTPADLLRMTAYKAYVPEEYMARYVDYYTIEAAGIPKGYPESISYYEDDWYLQEHPDFYQKVYLGLLGHKAINFNQVPSREVGALYIKYALLTTDAARKNFRLENELLETWLENVKGYKPIKGEVEKLSPMDAKFEEIERIRRLLKNIK